MKLGPPVCLDCLVIGSNTNLLPGHQWMCPICYSLQLKGSLLTFTTEFQTLVKSRSKLFTDNNQRTRTMDVQYSTRRRFMAGPGPEFEPNEYYRPWLEEHIGKQGVDWNWDLCRNDLDMLQIEFANKEHATIFELSWPQ